MSRMRRFRLAALLILAGCASAPRGPAVPHWDSIPPYILGALCTRLQMDAIGTTGPLAIAKTTQPIATPSAVGVVAAKARRPIPPGEIAAAVREGNAALPLSLASGACAWTPVDGSTIGKRHDEVVVALSAPMRNPTLPGEAGLFARVTLGEHHEWFWISLAPVGDQWAVRAVNALAL